MNANIKRLLAGLPALAGAVVTAADFYVAPNGNDANPGTQAKPFATLERARDAIRELKQSRTAEGTGDRAVGRAALTRWRGRCGSGRRTRAPPPVPSPTPRREPEPVVLDGGRRITGWKKHDDKLWVADVARRGQRRVAVPAAVTSTASSASAPARRTKGYLRVAGCPEGTPKTAHYHKDCQTFQFKPGDIRADWTNLSDVEVIVYHFWTDSHLPIKTVDTESNLVTFAHKAGKTFTDDFTEDGARYIVENVFEGLDAPGEWYLNRRTGQLFYYPMPGEDLAKAEVVAPFAPAHLRLEGKPAERRYVEHLRFRNLSFAYSNFEFRAGQFQRPAGFRQRACRHHAARRAVLRVRAMPVVQSRHLRLRGDGRLLGQSIRRATKSPTLAAGGIRVNGGKETQSALGTHAQQSHHRQLAAPLRPGLSVGRGRAADEHRGQHRGPQPDSSRRLHGRVRSAGCGATAAA